MMTNLQASFFDGLELKGPLADRMRPRSLAEFVGQKHLLGPGKLLRQLIEADSVSSMILWGPPGVGKTTLAMVVASATNANFIEFSAATSGMKEIKEVMARAEDSRRRGSRTVLFIDEIHRFNKAQQDAFLPHVEKGNIVLIGATTENPSFEVNSALISRSRVFVLQPLEVDDIVALLRNAIADERGLGSLKLELDDTILRTIAVHANGDARSALNTLDMAAASSPLDGGGCRISRQVIEECIQKKSLLYDKQGEEHYNIISALHKSMRNSDVDAAIYWLARMLEGGEDPLYVARRLVRFASEDVGMADPRALQIAVAAFQAVHLIGMPEGSVNLAQAAAYLALAPKSNALYKAYGKARDSALENVAEPVPLHLRNAPTKLMGQLGYGKGYQYAHDLDTKVADMDCLPDNLVGTQFYTPTDQGLEKNYAERLEYLRGLRRRK